MEAIAADAYGPDWEERGRHRLASLAGLLLLMFPSAPEAPAEVQTTLAETSFDEPSKLMSRIPGKVMISTACAGLVIVRRGRAGERPSTRSPYCGRRPRR